MAKKTANDTGQPRGLKGRKLGRRLLAIGGVGAIVWFAISGGEYTTFDLMSQKSRATELKAEVAALERVVDSLAKWKKAVQTDPAVQERIAREEFGMVRGNKELLYRFIENRE